MVTLDCWKVLQPCLESLERSSPTVSTEIILVDNASTDGTPGRIRELYPKIRVVENARNVGFTVATNQAIRMSSGRYLLWLNADTVMRPDALHQMWSFLETHPRAGIVGPMVLNADGSFQPQCRRGKPTVMAALGYFTRLNRLFPRSRRLGEYLLTCLPLDAPAPVVSVSGCCLLARRAVWDDIGALDEKMFGFGEDLDWCFRAGQAGWEIWYYPKSVITHLKGQGGTHAKPLRKVWGQHQAMWIFYSKHLRSEYSWAVNALVRVGIVLRYIVSAAGVLIRRAMH